MDATVAPPAPTTHALTLRSFLAGSVLAVFLCGVNSYLTLSFGVIEEGPTIAALFFFAFFFLSRRRISTSELVIVATMGSAGGSLGFITNFYAAKAMTGTPYTFWEMAFFAIVTSLVGLAFVIPLRELLVLREKLPWPGSKATAAIITALAEGGDRRQPMYLLATVVIAMAYVVLNDDGGFGLVPEGTELAIGGLAAFGAAIAWSPFAIGGAYLMGFRTCVGFLFGGITLLVMAPYLPTPSAPHRYVWPGISFLVSSGLTIMAVNWRVISDSMRSLFRLRKVATEGSVDDDPTLEPRVFVIFSLVALAAALAFMVLGMGLSVGLVLMLVIVGGFIQNIIATRAAAQTAFNPARVMGVLLQGLSALMGGSAAAVNLTGAGFVAGSGAQAGNLTGDMAYGRWFRVPSRWQFWTQLTTLIPCALVSAWVFTNLQATTPVSLEGGQLPAPVAKIWATSALIFDGSQPMPDGALTAMLIAAAIGVVWVLLETREHLHSKIPCSIGFGLGLVLPVSYDFSFFLGGFLMWIVGRRMLKLGDLTLTTIAVGCIVGEGLGGVLKPVLALLGAIK
ncbi:MAG: OPT/YSL family transporter [Deltaproteobacteria bacterium]|nr:OPT/YSL family transporter [Deltaproteobacteria bacterium]MCB9785688.1 OPT/YSL family transporter [Deltaproteobacteria bacterium]